MLASAEMIEVLAEALERHGKPVTMIDPVLSPLLLYLLRLRLRITSICL